MAVASPSTVGFVAAMTSFTAYGSAEHVVPAAELMGALHHHDVLGALHDAQDACVAPGVETDGALGTSGNVETA